ncbi:MAG: hypothetical protein RL367_1934 [Pseudomonadota bacterium]
MPTPVVGRLATGPGGLFQSQAALSHLPALQVPSFFGYAMLWFGMFTSNGVN